MSKHEKYGGSTIARTIQCPLWANLSATLPKRESASTFADEGSLLHKYAEMYFSGELAYSQFLDSNIHVNDVYLNQAMLDEKLAPAIHATHEAFNDDFDLYERAVQEPFVSLIPDLAAGSIDILSVSGDGKTLLVLDYKFGHHAVPAEDNKQLLFYALCAMVDDSHGLDVSDVERLKLVIIQPRDGECTPDVWDVEESYLDEFENEVYDAIELAECTPADAPTTANAGPACRFCPAEAICPLKTGQVANALRITPTQAEELSAALPLAHQLESWIRAVRTLAYEQAELGVKIDGYKLVSKRARRVWTDVEKATNRIRHLRGVSIADAQDHELKSPPQIEKMFKAKSVDFAKMSAYITSVSSGTTLVPEDDKREEALPIVALKLALNSST